MKDYTRQFGTYHDRAMASPVTLTKHGRDALVLLSAADYEKLINAAASVRRSIKTSETPQEIADFLLPALEEKVRNFEETKD